jgi:hypothetical protein
MSNDEPIAEAEELLRRERWPIVQKQLPQVCEELAKLCSISYTYSLRYIVRPFGSSHAVDPILTALDSGDRWAAILARFFRSVENFHPSFDQLTLFFEMILGIVSDLQRHAVDPFVRLVREEGHADASVLDGYGEFRRRWAKLVERTEELARLVGVRLDLSMYLTPDLHVPLKP